MFSAETLGLLIDCLKEVSWFHRDLDRIFGVARVPSSILQSVPVSPMGGRPSKRDKAEHVVMRLHERGEAGLGPLRSMVQQLLDWKNFNKAEDPERARQLVEQLRAATEVQTERRNVDLAAVQRRRAQYQAQIDEKQSYGEELVQLQRLFLEMIGWQDRSKRGIEFQKLLHRLFVISGLSPKAPFRIVGEEIDGAFVLDYDHFLLEARWRAEKTSEADLLVLRGKVEGKFDGTRGLFISVNNYTDGAITSITQGKRPNVILMGGEHLNHVLDGRMRFDDLLRELLRVASATGDVWVPLSVLAGYR